MSRLVNYSSEEDQDDYHKKVGERERTQRSSRGAHNLGAADRNNKRQLKKHYRERSISSSSSVSNGEHRTSGGKVVTPRKEKFVDDAKNKRTKNTSTSHNSSNNSSFSYNDEDKYKSIKRSEKYTRDESRDKRDNRDTKYTKERRSSRDYNIERSHDNSHYHENSKNDDNKRLNKDYKRDHNKRDSGNSDYHREDKRFRNDDKKNYSSLNYSKDRCNSSSKSRYDDRKSYDDRYNERREEKQRPNEDRRNSGHYTHSRKDESEYDDRNNRRNNNDERRGGQRSYSDKERTNSYKSNANKYPERRPDDERKYQYASEAADKNSELHNNTHREHSNETRSNDAKLTTSRGDGPEKKNLPSARNFEALLSLPLSETSSKEPSKITVPVVIAASEDPETSVQLPTYYNPKVINATKYATQMQKRKLIWGSKKTDDVAAKWGHAQFSQDSDGKVASKFMRLMGIKNAGSDSNADDNGGEKLPTAAAATSTNPDFKTREAMFSTMEQQYEVARQVTHTMRGVGLGFSSQSRPY